MKIRKILLFFVILLWSLASVYSFQLYPKDQKLIESKIETGFDLNSKKSWNPVIAQANVQWTNIQPIEDQFNWKIMDQITKRSSIQQLTLKWNLILKQQNIPIWINSISNKESSKTKFIYLSSFIQVTCQRYKKIDLIGLQSENLKQSFPVLKQIKHFCPNTKVLLIFSVKILQNDLVSQQILYSIKMMKDESLIEGIQFRLPQLTSKKEQLNYIQDLVEKIGFYEISLYISDLTIKRQSQNIIQSASQEKEEEETTLIKNFLQFLQQSQNVLGINYMQGVTDLKSSKFVSLIKQKYLHYKIQYLKNKNHQSHPVNNSQIDNKQQTQLHFSLDKVNEFGEVIPYQNEQKKSFPHVRLLAFAAPVAMFTASVNKLTVTVNASATTVDPTLTIASYSWNWGDAKTTVVTDGNPIASHVYTQAKSFKITLTVADSRNTKDNYNINVVTVNNVLPTASFTVTTTGYTVAVNSTSTDSDGNISIYDWNWGDSTTKGNLQNMTHSYQSPGTYSITLTVTDDYGGVCATPKVISVTVPTTLPTANFVATINKLSVDFDASSSSDPYATITSYAWTYGDGVTETKATATTSHTYTSVGTFTVTLKITDDHTANSSVSKTVTTVANVAPVANFGVVVSGYIATVNSTSTDSDGTVTIWAYSWGDNTANGTTENGTHNYATAGTYTITLIVKDNNGASSLSNKTLQVTVPSVMPSASFTATVTKLSVSFDTSATTSPSGAIASYLWTYGDGNTETKSTANATHVYSAAGTYTVTLKITDDHGAISTVSKSITTVANVLPVADFTTSVSGYTVTVNSSSTDSDGTVTIYAYQWGDGTSNGTTINETHSYTTAGTYTITLSVKDNDGASSASNKTLQVTVPSVMPSASFTATVTKLSVSFDTSATTSPSGTIASYLWTYGDGNTETKSTANATHVYSAAGTYTVTLKITDDHGAISTVSHAVTAIANVAPTSSFSIVSTTGYTIAVSSSAGDSDGTITSYNWDWNDTTTSNGATASPSHTFLKAGTYMVSLTVVDSDGVSTTSSSVSVTVPSVMPTATFNASVNGHAVSFDASDSTNQYGTISSYSWEFGDTHTQSTSTPKVTHVYDSVGQFTVKLTIVDQHDAQVSVSKSVTTVTNNLPTAGITVVSLSGYELNVTSSSTDSDGTISSFVWGWNDSTTNDNTKSPSHTFTKAGTYKVSLLVTDDSGGVDSTFVYVSVPTQLPTASFSISSNLLDVQVDASSSVDPHGTIISYVWDWGDGSKQTTASPIASHTYLYTDLYAIKLKVSDNKGAISTQAQHSVSAYKAGVGQLKPNWKWQSTLMQQTKNSQSYFLSTSRWLNKDGTITNLYYFSKNI